MKEPVAVKIRDYQPQDGPAIMAIQAGSPQAAPWRVEDYQQLAADPGGLVLVAEFDPLLTLPPSSHVAATSGVPVEVPASLTGFVAFHRVGEEAELRNLAVAAGWRRQGMARRLVSAGHRRLLAAGVRRVFLEVRASNAAALSLYSSIGYSTSLTRKAYYRDPEEDALVLSLALQTS